MKKGIIAAVVLGIFFSPAYAFAHERQVFTIGGKQYLFTVGSLNEPLVVDDKSGVDLRVKLADPAKPEDGSSPRAIPVTGLEKSLKVEVAAGSAKKTVDLSPAYNDPGAYKAVFYPTVQTTLSYRFFGTVDGTPVDITFTCSNAGHEMAMEDRSEKKISDTVTRTLQVGAFGCPLSKSDLTFPESVPSLAELAARGGSLGLTYAALALSLVALIAASRRRSM